MVDIEVKWEREALERYVIDCFQNAGVVDPSAGTRLAHMDKDKCEFALKWLEFRHGICLERDYRTVGELADELGQALKPR